MKKQLLLGLVLLGSVGSVFAKDVRVNHYLDHEERTKQLCTKRCKKHGGWTGSWFNQEGYHRQFGFCTCKK